MEQDKLLLGRAYQHAKGRPDAPYMTQPMGGGVVDVFSWSRTLDEAKRMAAHIRGLGLPEKSQIAILSKNCAHFILTDLAIWMAGHVSVAIYPTLDADTLGYILEHSESKLLFLGKLDKGPWEAMKDGVPADMPCITYPLSLPSEHPTWNDIVAETDPIEDEPHRDADDLSIIVYTSGSTGRPKGVMHSFGAMAVAVEGVLRVLSASENDRMLSYLPLAHVFERWVVESTSLYSGGQVFFAESLDTFVQDLQRARPTLFVSVPRLWLKFQQGVFKKMPPKKLSTFLKIPILSGIVKKKILGNLGLDQVRFAGSGSAPIPGELIQWYRDLGLELLEGYGMSENFAYSHISFPGEARVGYVGGTYPGVECKISDEQEILVKSPANMLGYFKQEELTEESFVDGDTKGFLKTGDQGEIDDHGRLRITGRVKELFKTSKGKYIAPAPIENIVSNHELIEASCVSGLGMPQPYALVMLGEEVAPTTSDPAVKAEITAALETLLTETNAKLQPYEHLHCLVVVPDRWTIEEGFLTPTMKIKRSVIEATYKASVEGWYAKNESVLWHG